MRRLVLFLIALSLPLLAQDKPQEPPVKNQQKLFILKYADPQKLAELLRIYDASKINANTEMHALTVTASATTMQAIEEAIAKLDVASSAPKDFDFTIYLVVGSESEAAASGGLPKDLDSVVAQLRSAFAFKNYRLLDVLSMRTRAGQSVQTSSAGGTIQFGNVAKSVVTSFGIRSASLSPDGTTIRLERMSSRTSVPVEVSPGNYSQEGLSLDTDLDIKEGQKVVVGRMGMTNQQALFLVITVKIVP